MGIEAVNPNRSDTANTAAIIASLIREVPDFPTPGIQFKDVTPVFADAAGLAAVTAALTEVAAGADLIAGVDARGFLVAGAVADRLGVGALAVRKQGKLPPPVLSEVYELEYGTAALEIPADGIELAGRTVVIVDDVLATGGTLAATYRLMQRAGAIVTAAAVVLEMTDLGGRAAVAPLQVHSLHRL